MPKTSLTLAEKKLLKEKEKEVKPMSEVIPQTLISPPDFEKSVDSGQDIEQAFSAGMKSMGDKVEFPDVLTELTKAEIMCFSILTSLNEIDKADSITAFQIAFYRLRISHKRKSRGEMTNIIKAVGNAGQHQQEGWIQKLRNVF